jgi:hypothetical protein
MTARRRCSICPGSEMPRSEVSRSAFASCRFLAEVIVVGVRWYLRSGLTTVMAQVDISAG